MLIIALRRIPLTKIIFHLITVWMISFCLLLFNRAYVLWSRGGDFPSQTQLEHPASTVTEVKRTSKRVTTFLQVFDPCLFPHLWTLTNWPNISLTETVLGKHYSDSYQDNITPTIPSSWPENEYNLQLQVLQHLNTKTVNPRQTLKIYVSVFSSNKMLILFQPRKLPGF